MVAQHPPAALPITTTRPAKATIGALTGIRAIAALWVVFFHLRSTIPTLLPESRGLRFLLDSGFLGVDVFFVLSGFIISYTYADRSSSMTRRDYRRFLVARIARIYPVHVFALALMAAVLLWASTKTGRWDPTYTVGGLVGNLLMLQALPGLGGWNVPSWSVSCELVAYLVFPGVAALVLRSGRRTAIALCLALSATLAVVAFALGWDPATEVLMYWVRIAAGFTGGCLLWRFWSLAVRPSRRWDAAVVIAVAGAATVLWFVDGPASFAVAPLIALFVLGAASATGVVASVLASRPMQWGGRISYSLYLVHMPVFYTLVILYPPQLFLRFPLPVRAGALVVYLGAMIVAAALTFRFVEEPARRALRRWASARDERAVAPSS